MNEDVRLKLLMSISDLGLDNRAINALLNFGELKTIIDLCRYHYSKNGTTLRDRGLRIIRHFGSVSIAKLEARLEHLGLAPLSMAETVVNEFDGMEPSSQKAKLASEDRPASAVPGLSHDRLKEIAWVLDLAEIEGRSERNFRVHEDLT